MKDVSTNISGLRPVTPAVIDGTARGQRPSDAAGDPAAFRETLAALQGATPGSPGDSGSQALAQAGRALRFSNHAIDRMQTRGIRFSPVEMNKIEGAITKAATKGARETLLLTDKAALVVSVKDNTVVTVMDRDALRENVFTNIDSTVVI